MMAATTCLSNRPAPSCPGAAAGQALFETELRDLLQAASDSVLLSVRYFLRPCRFWPEMPDCETPAQHLETKARTVLMRTNLSASQTEAVTNALKCGADLRCVARGASEAANLSRLTIAQDVDIVPALAAAVSALGGAVRDLAQEVSVIAEPGSGGSRSAAGAAAAYRAVDLAYAQVAAVLRATSLAPAMRRMIGAAAWSLLVSAENLARTAARFAFAK